MALVGPNAGSQWQFQPPAQIGSIADLNAAQSIARLAQAQFPRPPGLASATQGFASSSPGPDIDPGFVQAPLPNPDPGFGQGPDARRQSPAATAIASIGPVTPRSALRPSSRTPASPAIHYLQPGYRPGMASLGTAPRRDQAAPADPAQQEQIPAIYRLPGNKPHLPPLSGLKPALRRDDDEAPPLRISDGRRRPALENGYAPPDYLVAPIRLADGTLLHVNADDLADPRYVNIRNLNPDGFPVKGRAGLQPRALFHGAVLTHPPFYGTTYRPGQPYPSMNGLGWDGVSDLLDRFNPRKRQQPEVILLSAKADAPQQPVYDPAASQPSAKMEPMAAKDSAAVSQPPPPSQEQAPGPRIPPLLARPQTDTGTSPAQDKGSDAMPYWQRLGQMNRFGAQGAPAPPPAGDRYLDLSPEQITRDGLARGASPAQIAADLQAQRDRLHEHHARNGSPDNYRTTAPLIDKDIQSQLDTLFHQHLLGQLATLLPRQEDRQELLQQLEAQGGDISRLSPRYAGLADKLRGFVSQEQQRFLLPASSDRHKINSSGGPLADYGWNETSNRAYVHLEPRKPGAQPLLIDVPRVTQRDVDTELARAKDSAEAARQSLQRLSDMPTNLQFGYAQGLVAARADANEQLKQAEARIAQLSGGNAHSVLTTERVMEEIKKPQYRGVIGDFGGWQEMQKGILDTIFALGAGGARMVGAEDTFQHIAEARANLDTALPGSTRADIEGGGWTVLRDVQRGGSSLLPYLATGAILGLGGSAVARAGMAGLGGIAGAGQSMLDTRQRIQEVQEHLEQFPGDEQARLQLQHLQDGANLHALLSGGLSAGASLLPVPGLSGATRGVLPSVARQAVAGTAQNVAQGVVQHGLIDPVRGDSSDPFATLGPDTLFGLGGAIVHAGKDALSARWGSSAKPGQPQSQAPNGAPEPGVQPPLAIRGSKLEQWADTTLVEARKRFNSGLDPTVAAAVTVKAAALMEGGLHNFSEWSQAMLQQHGEAITPHLPEIWIAAVRLGSGQTPRREDAIASSLMEEFVTQSPRAAPVAENLSGSTSSYKTSEAESAVKKQLLPGEGKVGPFRDLNRAGSKGDNVTPHHIPSSNHMAKHGISREDGISINMEQPTPGTGGRHRETFNYGNQADVHMPSRIALGTGVWDARRIYKSDELYGAYIRQQLREMIRLQKTSYPQIFKKQ